MSLKWHIKLKTGIFLMILAFHAAAINQNTAEAEMNYFDEKLNKYYKKILAKLDPNEQIKLKKSTTAMDYF